MLVFWFSINGNDWNFAKTLSFCRYLVPDFVKLTSKWQQYRWDTLYIALVTDRSPSFPGWSPAATMYVLPMVLIFSKTLNFGLDSSCNIEKDKDSWILGCLFKSHFFKKDWYFFLKITKKRTLNFWMVFFGLFKAGFWGF